MKHLCLLFLILTLTSCFRPSKDKQTEQEEPRGFSSLYDQGNTSACWIYAMLTCIEREQAITGDTVILSRHWLIAKGMEEHTRRIYQMHANGYDITGPDKDRRMAFTMRGVGPEAIRLINRYGLIPYEYERTHVTNDRMAIRRLTQVATTATSPDDLEEKMHDILPQFTVARHTYGSNSPSFYYYSMRYTPQQFASSIMYHQQWQFYASEQMHPWGDTFALETPDNYRYHEYMNLPIDSIASMVMTSLRKGHPVYWEYGKRGRTSDHAMAIIGIKHDKKTHEPLLLCQNSYGLRWGNHGCCAVTLDYFKTHTSNVGILNSAIFSEK